MKVRLQKFLSDAGAASRRKAEELILEGFVAVNDEIVDTLPAFVDPQKDRVIVKGNRVRPQPLRWFVANKPKNVVCSDATRQGRLRVVDLLPDLNTALRPVGRLDPEATGLVLMTNDGELADTLARPASQVPREYVVEIKGRADGGLVERLRKGAYLSEGRARVEEVQIEHAGEGRSVLRVTTFDRYPRMIQRLCAKLGHDVKTLKRVALGPIEVKRLAEGAVRELTPAEVRSLRDAVRGRTRRNKPGRRKSGKTPARSQQQSENRTESATESQPVRRRLVE